MLYQLTELPFGSLPNWDNLSSKDPLIVGLTSVLPIIAGGDAQSKPITELERILSEGQNLPLIGRRPPLAKPFATGFKYMGDFATPVIISKRPGHLERGRGGGKKQKLKTLQELLQGTLTA